MCCALPYLGHSGMDVEQRLGGLQVGNEWLRIPHTLLSSPLGSSAHILSESLPVLEGLSPTRALEVELGNLRAVTASLGLPALPWVMGVET